MKPSNEKEVFTYKRLVDVFFIFVLGTVAFMILIFYKMPDIPIKQGLTSGLLMLGILSYEFVVMSLLSYYVIQAKQWIINNFEEYRKKYLYPIVIVLGLSYALLEGVINKSFLAFLRALILITITIIGLPFIADKLKKK